MNITLLTNRDPQSVFATTMLLPVLTQHKVSLFTSSKVGGRSNDNKHLSSLSEFELALFQSDYMSEHLVSKASLLDNINTKEGVERLREITPDLIICIRFGKILRPAAINTARLGVINLHSGLLPEFKGIMATFWSMLQGCTHIGATIHTIDDAGIDSGKILASCPFKINYAKSYIWNTFEVYRKSIPQLAKIINNISVTDRIDGEPQKAQGQYYTYPNATELEQFYQLGHILFNDEDLQFKK